MYEAAYLPLSESQPEWGSVAILPWDCETFGFPVGDLRAGDPAFIAHSIAAFKDTFNNWADDAGAEIVSCSVPAKERTWLALMPQLGFSYVDSTLRIFFSPMQKWVDVPTEIPVRQAVPEDEECLGRIAQIAFQAGRYHMDPRFPRLLSERRYRRWLTQALQALGPRSRLYVTGDVGQVTSFCHVNMVEDEGQVTIIAVEPTRRGSRTTLDLCRAVFNDLKSIGVRKMGGKISAMNTDMQNVAAYFGMKFADPETVFHWHSPHPSNLVAWNSIFEQ